uniref:Uncharacterized protein n=1 Tax=Glossina pallidipes TaxID=7398 RepID=A0A1A9ZE24_GLOPL
MSLILYDCFGAHRLRSLHLEALVLVDTLRFDDEEVMDLWSIFLFFVICFLLMSCCGYCCTKKRRGAVLSDIHQNQFYK